MNPSINDLKKRILTGTMLVIVILILVWLGPLSSTMLLLFISLFSLNEFYRLLETPQVISAYILSCCLILTCVLLSSHIVTWNWLLLNIPVALGIFIEILYRPSSKPFYQLAIIFLGIICISLPSAFFLALPFLRDGSYHFHLALGVFLLLWANDTGAYLSGKLFGKHPLFKRISPKKTWEGSFGGFVVVVTTGYILAKYINLLSILHWESLALITVIFGTYGDLIKSMLKRSLNIKDSGTILPGHGGMLDRFDSLFGAAPFMFCYLTIVWK